MTKKRSFLNNKTGATNCCISKGIEIKGQVCFASLKQNLYREKPVYWADNDDKTFLDRDWTFILNNYEKKCFYVIFIPKGKLTPDLKRANRNKGLFDWNIKVAFYKDVDTDFDFNQFGILTVPYSDDDIQTFDK